MQLSPLAFWLGCSGLLPFLLGPAWHQFAGAQAPPWLDAAWLNYAAMIASFMAGSFWGFALPASQGSSGLLGLVLSAVLMLLAWGSMLLPLRPGLCALAVVFLLLLAAEVWRERVLDTLEGYFRLRLTLTVGVLAAIGWRLLQA